MQWHQALKTSLHPMSSSNWIEECSNASFPIPSILLFTYPTPGTEILWCYFEDIAKSNPEGDTEELRSTVALTYELTEVCAPSPPNKNKSYTNPPRHWHRIHLKISRHERMIEILDAQQRNSAPFSNWCEFETGRNRRHQIGFSKSEPKLGCSANTHLAPKTREHCCCNDYRYDPEKSQLPWERRSDDEEHVASSNSPR